MAYKVVLDANTLYPFSLRDLLLRLREKDLYVHVWSERILDEMSRNLVRDELQTSEQSERLVAVMRRAFPEAEAEASGLAIDKLEPHMPNDPGDRHVLAAAVVSGAEAVITFNRKHFRPEHLDDWGKDAVHPDDFLCNLADMHPAAVKDALREQSADLKRPPLTVADLLDLLQLGGVPNFVQLMRDAFDLPPRTRAQILEERASRAK
jgi:predicted nucleic acid-binding protein